jgi:hypothetical protein
MSIEIRILATKRQNCGPRHTFFACAFAALDPYDTAIKVRFCQFSLHFSLV